MFAGWGWAVLPCMGYIAIVPVGMVWLLSGLLWDRVYKWESLGLQQGIIFQETDQSVEDFSLE